MCDVYSMVDGAEGDEEERSGGSGGNWSRRLLQTAGTMQLIQNTLAQDDNVRYWALLS